MSPPPGARKAAGDAGDARKDVRETGDRLAFLGHLRRRLADPSPANLAHPLPAALEGVPLVRTSLLDPDDVVGSFLRNATATRAVVHDLDLDAVPAGLVADVVARHGLRTAVVSAEPEAAGVGDLLEQAGVSARPHTPEEAATADVGVTSCIAAIAATGTVVLSSRRPRVAAPASSRRSTCAWCRRAEWWARRPRSCERFRRGERCPPTSS